MESSFQIASCECPDINASTLAVDVTGQHAIISSRKSLVLFDLDGNKKDNSLSDNYSADPSTKLTPIQSGTVGSGGISSISNKGPVVAKRMIRNAKYEPTASQFSRLVSDLFALTTYQVVDIFSIEDLNSNKPKLSLKGHSRAIADIEWSNFDPYLLGSSAADCMTNLWDIRDNRRPAATLTSVSGSTLVRFSKTSSNILATSHEIDVRIWDIRQPNLPLNYIAAHLQKINGMDWNPSKTNCENDQLITCSQDNTIKLWDLSANKVKPKANLQTRTPAWRVRYTPVSSNAILTSLLPQLRSRSECLTLKLWSMKPDRYEQKKLEMILSLAGHTDVIVDFDWRSRPSSNSCEIVSWSKDQTLRLWRVDNQFIEMNVDNSDFETECGIAENACESFETSSIMNDNYHTGDVTKSSSRSKQNTPTSTVGTDAMTKSPKTKYDYSDDSDQDGSYSETPTGVNELKQEFNLINKNIPNIQFEELNSLRRVCVVTAHARISCRLRIALPPSYPHSDCPTFTIIDSDQYGGEGLTKETKEKLLSLLDETAKSQLDRSRNCIEPCLRKFIAALQKISSHGSHRKRTSGSGTEYKDDPITLSAQRDHSVPFPHTSGAKFCGNLLVCFGRPMIPTINMSTGGDSANYLVETPRSMAQLSAQLDNMRRQGSYNLSYISISYFYYGIMRRAELANRSKNLTPNSRAGSKYLPNRGKSSQSVMSKNFKCGPVLIYDVSSLLGGLSQELAESYVFHRDVIKMCRKNAEIAASYNRKDLVQIWSLAELSSEGVLSSHLLNKDEDQGVSLANFDSDFGDRPWTMHPFGSKLIQSLIDHYVHNCHDVQTAAMLVWTFSSPKSAKSNNPRNIKYPTSATGTVKSNSNPLYNVISNYHTVIPGMLNSKTSNTVTNNIDTISGEWSFVNGPETHPYSNSWSNSTIHENLAHESQHSGDSKEIKSSEIQASNDENEDKLPRLNILSSEGSLQNDLIMHIYAELLYRLNLLNQRAMVLKNIGSNSAYSGLFGDKQNASDSPEERLPNLTILCSNINCRNRCNSAQCPSCKRYSLCCSICRLPVKGSCSICLKCLHGGHVNHFKTWFSSYEFCPTGCGCKCLSTD